VPPQQLRGKKFIINMYNNRYSGGFRGNNNQQGQFRNFSGQQSRGRFGNNNGNGGRRGFSKSKIDRSLYVRQAEEFVSIEETVTNNSFTDFNLRPELLVNVEKKGYIKPTKIQDEAIPQVLQGRDVLGIANTGTGKTAAFVLPLIDKVLHNPGERIIILAPTRELAEQIMEEVRSFTWGLRIYVTLVIGGASMRQQAENIRRGPQFIIGTPGRIKDLGERRIIDFSRMNTVVLDEVDRMLDMGFINDIRAIVDQTPKSRQTLFFSATIDRKIQPLIDQFLTDPVRISVESANASTHVEQNIVRVERYAKEEKLQQLMRLPEFKKVLIFGATRRIVEKLSVGLGQKGFRAQGLHGGKQQRQRQRIVADFRDNRFSILVATDVAARGLDIVDITHVINYDEPNNYQEYIHRIGRTGRVNNKGVALTFVD
jgi:superfamily II DNA/RNA helicase